MQIYATIDSPEETKVLFEPLQMHYLDVSSKLKLLEDKKKYRNKNSKGIKRREVSAMVLPIILGENVGKNRNPALTKLNKESILKPQINTKRK